IHERAASEAARPLAPGSRAGSRRARRAAIRAHLLRWRPRPGRSTYREYASRPGFGRRLAAGPFSPPVAPPCSADMGVGAVPSRLRLSAAPYSPVDLVGSAAGSLAQPRVSGGGGG